MAEVPRDHKEVADMKPKERKELFRELQRAGWRITQGRRGWMCYSPDGKHIVAIHNTASEYRGARNVLSEFKKAGFNPHGERKVSA